MRLTAGDLPQAPHPTPMSPGEQLDPLPDTFILQPPVFHPVSSCSGLETPGSQGSPSSWAWSPRLAGAGVMDPVSPAPAHGSWKVVLSLE